MKRFDKKINVWIDGELLQFIMKMGSLRKWTASEVIREVLRFGCKQMKTEN